MIFRNTLVIMFNVNIHTLVMKTRGGGAFYTSLYCTQRARDVVLVVAQHRQQSLDTGSDKGKVQHPKPNSNADLDLEQVIEQLEQTRAELQNANNEKEYLRYKLKESNMRIRNHKGSIGTFTQKLKTKKKQITKLERQNVSHLEEKLRLKHEIAWLTDKLENKKHTGC